MEEVEDDNGVVRSIPNKPQKMTAQRWSKLKQHRNKSLVIYVDSEKHFVFRPYTFTPQGITGAKLYAALRGAPVDIFANEIPMYAMTWLAISSPTLLPFITESKSRGISYNPQRVLR